MSEWITSGIGWNLRQIVAPAEEPLDLEFVRDLHLRSPNGTVEDAYIEGLITTARQMAERTTNRAIPEQQWTMSAYRFPCGALPIEVPFPPLISVDAISYLDENGATQTLDVNADVNVAAPLGPRCGKALITPTFDTTWPTAQYQADSVSITFTAGYVLSGSPVTGEVPSDITHGMLLVIGELYKQRSESVHAPNQSPALIRARDLWLPYRVY